MTYYTVTVKRTVYQELVAHEVEADTPEQAREYVERDLRTYSADMIKRTFDIEDVDYEHEIESVMLEADRIRGLIDNCKQRLAYAEKNHLGYEVGMRRAQLARLQQRLEDYV